MERESGQMRGDMINKLKYIILGVDLSERKRKKGERKEKREKEGTERETERGES